MNKPDCERCQTNLYQENHGQQTPTNEDREFNATQVEGYRCTSCRGISRFVRYNHPMKLIETRTGRCGEWTNCFTSICIALGYEARQVLDWTDHIWTEVWIDKYQRWVHVDACEPKGYDAPLMYEQGWGKELTYVIAFSPEEVVDVTQRYVAKKLFNRMRRDQVNEKWLQEHIKKIRENMWEMQGPGRSKVLAERFEKETEELNTERLIIKEDEIVPRESGDLDWKTNRGEMGRKGDGVMSTMAGYRDTTKDKSYQIPTSAPVEKNYINFE